MAFSRLADWLSRPSNGRHARRLMDKPHGRLDLVDVLAALAAASRKFDFDIGRIDDDL